MGHIPLPDDVARDHFTRLLGRYEEVIQRLSDSKPPKAGSKTLAELDKFRYEDAVESFSSSRPRREMTHADVKRLVEWKLRHGKYRPTLMSLVSNNDSTKVAETIKSAMETYWKDKDASAALTTIATLKGIGPATAALLLSVHDPEEIIFFSDEAFWWLCCGGEKQTIKYTPKEYSALIGEAQTLSARLGASAMDIEKVAYVLFRGGDQDDVSPEGTAGVKPTIATKNSMKKREPATSTVEKGTKRKSAKEPEEVPAGVRRSKRGKT